MITHTGECYLKSLKTSHRALHFLLPPLLFLSYFLPSEFFHSSCIIAYMTYFKTAILKCCSDFTTVEPVFFTLIHSFLWFDFQVKLLKSIISMFDLVHLRVSLGKHSNQLLLVGYTCDCKSFPEFWFHNRHIFCTKLSVNCCDNAHCINVSVLPLHIPEHIQLYELNRTKSFKTSSHPHHRLHSFVIHYCTPVFIHSFTNSFTVPFMHWMVWWQCAQDCVTRDLVRQHGGLDPLVKLAKDVSIWDDKPLLAAVTGAIWKCAISPENVRRLDELHTVSTLVSLLSDENDEVRFRHLWDHREAIIRAVLWLIFVVTSCCRVDLHALDICNCQFIKQIT